MKKKCAIVIFSLIYNRQNDSFLVEKVSRSQYELLRETVHAVSWNGDTLEDLAYGLITSKIGMSNRSVSVLDYSFVSTSFHLFLFIESDGFGESGRLKARNLVWQEQSDLHVQNSSQILYKFKVSASEFLKNRAIASELKHYRIVDCAQRAIEFVSQNKIEQESHKLSLLGWPHDLGKEKIGVIGTAIGILCFTHVGVTSPVLFKAIETLQSFQNPDGGWATYSSSSPNESPVSVTESTLYCLWAMLEFGLCPEDESIKKAVAWLRKIQNSSGGWGTTESSESARVFPTAFAVRILAHLDSETNTIEKAVGWLRSARNDDGGWGIFSRSNIKADSNYLSNASYSVHTAHAVLALMAAKQSDSNLIKGGLDFILSHYSSQVEEGWESISEEEYIAYGRRLDFKHFGTPWCIIALARAEVSFPKEVLFEPFNALLSKQHDLGYWEHKFKTGLIPIWATHDCLLAIKEVRLAASSNLGLMARNYALENRYSVLQKVMVQLIRTQVSSSGQRSLNLTLIVWNALITVVLVVVVATSSSLRPLFSRERIPSSLATIIVAFLAGLAPFIYSVLLEEYKLRRRQGPNE